MPTLSVDDLFTPPTEDELLDQKLTDLETDGIPARSWRQGGAYRAILRVTSRIQASAGKVIASLAKSGFLGQSSGDWLKMLAKSVFNVDAKTASKATGYELFTNTAAAVFGPTPLAVGSVRLINSTTKKTFINAEAFTLDAYEAKLVKIEATEAGSASSSGAGEIDALETTMIGVEVSNPSAIAGSDDETDDELTTACENRRGTFSLEGPRTAYSFAVRDAKRTDGTFVDINRVSVVPNKDTGVVTVYCASPSGVPISSDIDAAADNVEAIARPDTVTAVVAPVTPVALTATITVWAIRTPGVSATDISTLVNDALIAAVEAYPIGGIAKPGVSTQGYLYGDFIAGVAKGAHASIYDIDGADEDLAINPGEVATLAATITVRLVST